MSDDPKAAAIEQMVNALNSAGSIANPQVQPSPSMRFSGETGEVTYIDSPPPALPEGVVARLADSGYDLNGQAQTIASEISAIEAKLAEHHFDKATGAKIDYVTGRERDVLTAQLAVKQRSQAYYADQSNRLAEQRQADLIAKQVAANEKLAKAAFINGDPQKAALLDEELKRAEAAAVAAAIVNARKAQRG